MEVKSRKEKPIKKCNLFLNLEKGYHVSVL